MSERIILIVCVVTRQADLEDTSAATVGTHTQQESTVLKRTFSLDSFVLDSNSPTKAITVTPTSITTATKSSTTQAQPEITSNPTYEEWRRSDLLILVWLRQIIYDPLLGHLTRASSSYDAWTKIVRMFQSQTCARLMQLKSQLQNFSKGNLSILEYFEKKRAIVALNMRSGTITPEELFGLLLQEEERLAEELRSTTINTQLGAATSRALLTHNSSFIHPASALNVNQSSILCPPPLSNYLAHNSHNHAQSMVPQQYSHSSRSNNRQSKRRVQCQICGKNNHDARNCYNCSNDKDFPPTRQTPSRSIPKQAHLASPSAIVDPPAWYFDSGATHLVTSDMANLSLQTYTDNDGLAVGNAVTNKWSVRQLDINNAFLNGDLSEQVFMEQPKGFVDPHEPHFLASKHATYVLVYVDDLIITGSDSDFITTFIHTLDQQFSLKDLGSLNYFLGIEVSPTSYGIILSQGSVVGALQYVTITRPEISYAVNRIFVLWPSRMLVGSLILMIVTPNMALQYSMEEHLPTTTIPRHKPASVELGRFRGDNLEAWIFQAERYFDFYRIEEDQRLTMASFFLDGEALEWYRWLFRNNQLVDWPHFAEKVRIGFKQTGLESAGGRLAKLRQVTTVSDLQGRFEAIVNETDDISNRLMLRSLYLD
ncbi:hypothetical protein MTR67_003364 [Solanum verrucosum]|uniref:Reverse transcriptase Ty1/copia-type domain-containing protein n=1 Tax=Solanum verrucosum TaxID=315347 RepID=A0AAF0PXX3_SOLVR|nr:hypothetical protein MTR67_003364 [Solanum verrucosum]